MSDYCWLPTNAAVRTICRDCIPLAHVEISRAETQDGMPLFKQLWVTPPEPEECEWCHELRDCFNFIDPYGCFVPKAA